MFKTSRHQNCAACHWIC